MIGAGGYGITNVCQSVSILGGSIPVTATWVGAGGAAQALADIQAATGMVFNRTDEFVYIWEGPTDSDDFAVLHAAGAGAPEWLSHTGQPSAFASPPVGGMVYLTAIIYQP